MAYGARGHSSLFPLDRVLNLPVERYSHGLLERASREVAKQSFDEVVAAMKQESGGKMPKRQLETMVIATSQDFEAFYAANETAGPEQRKDLLILSVDGKGVVMRGCVTPSARPPSGNVIS